MIFSTLVCVEKFPYVWYRIPSTSQIIVRSILGWGVCLNMTNKKFSENRVQLCRNRMVLISFLNFSDWFCTTTILKNDGFFELNPLMAGLVDNPLLCFAVKCIVPLLLIIYIYHVLPQAGEKILYAINFAMVMILIFYLAINILHIFNFAILFILQ